jgi:hypothetical protein
MIQRRFMLQCPYRSASMASPMLPTARASWALAVRGAGQRALGVEQIGKCPHPGLVAALCDIRRGGRAVEQRPRRAKAGQRRVEPDEIAVHRQPGLLPRLFRLRHLLVEQRLGLGGLVARRKTGKQRHRQR